MLLLPIFKVWTKKFKWGNVIFLYMELNSQEMIICERLLIAFVAGLLIGFDREKSGKAAGLKTQMLVCVGSALFAGLSIYLANSLGVLNQDPTRIMAQVVSGVGFLGAGVILKNGNRLSGVTTAATIWTTAAVGVAIGSGYYLPAAITVMMVLLLNPIAYLQYKLGTKTNSFEVITDRKNRNDIEKILSDQKMRILQKSVNQTNIIFHFLSNEQKNDRLIQNLDAKGIVYSLESTED